MDCCRERMLPSRDRRLLLTRSAETFVTHQKWQQFPLMMLRLQVVHGDLKSRNVLLNSRHDAAKCAVMQSALSDEHHKQ